MGALTAVLLPGSLLAIGGFAWLRRAGYPAWLSILLAAAALLQAGPVLATAQRHSDTSKNRNLRWAASG